MDLDGVLRDLKQKINAGEQLSLEELEKVTSQMSAKIDGAEVALLYSGDLGLTGSPSLHAWQAAEHIGEDSAGLIATISQTDVAKLLNSEEFISALEQSVDLDNAKFTEVMYGATAPDGTRLQPGLWDRASERFVLENGHKPIVTITPFAQNGSVYAQTEFPSMLAMDGNTLEGFSRNVFADIADGAPNGLVDARLAASAVSLERVGGLSYHISSNPGSPLLGVDTSNFWLGDLSHLAESPSVSADTLIISQADLITNLSPTQKSDIVRGMKLIEDAVPGQKLVFLNDLGKNGGLAVGAVVGVGLAAHEIITGTPAQAAEVFYETVVPYGETQIDLARMDLEAAAHSATVETASNAGCIVVGAIAGGAVTYFSAGTAVPTGVTVAAGAGGCLVGGVVVGFATDAALNSYDAIKDGVGNAVDGLKDGVESLIDDLSSFFNDVSGVDDTAPALDADTAYAVLPDQLAADMPPEVESLVLFKSDRPMFDMQFNEISEYGGLPEVARYIEAEALGLGELQNDVSIQDVQQKDVSTPAYALPSSSL